MSDGVNYNFNQRRCIKALKYIGFIDDSKRRGRHFKFVPPKYIKDKIVLNKPSFIMVPKHKELRVQSLIITELKEMGGEELVNSFLENL